MYSFVYGCGTGIYCKTGLLLKWLKNNERLSSSNFTAVKCTEPSCLSFSNAFINTNAPHLEDNSLTPKLSLCAEFIIVSHIRPYEICCLSFCSVKAVYFV
uniref:Uncharacterized protein n=1 Tax=Anguilla anguilla TaxID=7936 RepID=A0A0E9WPT8_ANGAN